MNARDGHIWRLQETPGVGPAAIARVLQHYGIPDAPFYGRDPAWYWAEFGIPERASATLSSTTGNLEPPDDPVRALTLRDAGYPPQLRAWSTPPPVLWTLNTRAIELTNDNISIIGSAGEEEMHVEAVKAALNAGIAAGYRLVAGHNRPVYQWALLAAKRCGAPSVMALDRGLMEAFDDDLNRDPIAPARIWGYAFDAERCTVLSPFRLHDGWIGSNSRIRDSLVVGLSDVVVAIGVRPGGTMHRLCREALCRGRTVYADGQALPLLADMGARPWTGHLER